MKKTIIVSAIFLSLLGGFALGSKGIRLFGSGKIAPKYAEEYSQKVNAGLSEIAWTHRGSPNEAAKSVETLNKFLHRRAGWQLSKANQNTLEIMTREFAEDRRRGLGPGDINHALIIAFDDRLKRLSDGEIDTISRSLAGCPPDGECKRDIRLRSWYFGGPSYNQFATALKDARSSSIVGSEHKITGAWSIEKTANDRWSVLSTVAPDKFSGAIGTSPIGALLFAYSVVADDQLNDADTELKQKMKKHANNIYKRNPSDGELKEWHPYGEKGVFYKTPLSLVMDETFVSQFLTVLNEKSLK